MSDEVATTVKNFVSLQVTGALSTISRSLPGCPFGSIVPYDLAEDGSAIIFISRISEHYRNLVADPRSSLLVWDTFGERDPQSHGRATLMGDFLPVPEAETSAMRDSYASRFPNSKSHELTHDFEFFRCVPQKIRWIGGFGTICWVNVGEYTKSPRDPIAYIGMSVISHMNEDHGDALQKYRRRFFPDLSESDEVTLVEVDTTGFVLSLRQGSGVSRHRVNFPQPVANADQARQMFISLLK